MKMDQQKIQKIVAAELEERYSYGFPEQFQDTIDEYLVEPFEASFLNESTRDFDRFWVVGDLIPESPGEGHLLIYSPEEDLFGLAFKGNLSDDGAGIFLGLFGSLAQALENA
ncbi:MAG: hypothetical protein KA281_06735 [Bacteroidia bacterium]|jgi:hypothetical protein|nr:hypothetical protein [Bacteroidia bacterium]MBP6649248.1 hypothetical protein [Bacteroidia bacterium]